ncbi:hypothetical protein RRG08_036045 [Elysia crispata]|uniref:Uncharacterized protein n=1 Tax=Elysia crispata TaxID=231223 RepID=A0AAE1E0Q1_9GAST|nr:hypothetical protein RRG08_036045 [Elysia crispata]
MDGLRENSAKVCVCVYGCAAEDGRDQQQQYKWQLLHRPGITGRQHHSSSNLTKSHFETEVWRSQEVSRAITVCLRLATHAKTLPADPVLSWGVIAARSDTTQVARGTDWHASVTRLTAVQ